jgi:hypothetical protein
MKNKSLIIIILMFWSLSGFNLFGESLEQVLAKYYRGAGGLGKLKAIHTIIYEGKVDIRGLKLPYRAVYKNGKSRIDIQFPDQKFIDAFDGKKAWILFPQAGFIEPTEQSKKETEKAKDDNDSLFPLVVYKEKGYNLELVGREKQEGIEVYKVKMTKKSGTRRFYYLECKTGFLVKMSFYRHVKDDEVLVGILLSDFKNVDGVMMPFRLQVKENGKLLGVGVFYSTIKFNEKVDDSFFEMPKKDKK